MYKYYMNNYGIPYEQIDTFNNLKFGKYHYNYKTVDFMFNNKENSDILLIVFHGRVHTKEKWPVFYKHNYEKENVSVLSICDKLLETNRELHNVLYLSTNMIDYRNIYNDIIKEIIKCYNYKRKIFFGTCSGTYTALYYGCIFNGIVICANGYINIDVELFKKYDDKIYNNYKYNTLYIDNYEIISCNKPKHIYLFINKYDTITFEMNKKFIIYCKKNFPDIITATIHDNQIENKDPHDVFFPKNETFESIMNNICV